MHTSLQPRTKSYWMSKFESQECRKEKTMLPFFLSEAAKIIEKDQPNQENTIKALLALRNLSQTDIAKKYSISPSDLNKVISGKRKTSRIRFILANELGVEKDLLFHINPQV